MSEDVREFLAAYRRFVRPTLRGKIRAAASRLSRKLFPPKPIPRFRPGDIVSMNGRELTVRKCRGRFVEFTDGSEAVVS